MTKKEIAASLAVLSLSAMSPAAIAQSDENAVSQERMSQVYAEAQTPYKYGLVVAPNRNDRKYDCPTVFREGGKWYMTYVCYNGKEGTDGRGYETWLATSEDLLHWETLGLALAYSNDETSWDANQRGGFPSLIDMDWDGTYDLGSYEGRHWMTYIGGHGRGYEAVKEPLSIGLASTDETIAEATEWTCEPEPIMSYKDPDAQWWERMTQYKSTIYKMDKRLLGEPYVMFYNAGGKDDTHPKGERIGIALSPDMKTWRRYVGNPVFAHDTDGTITGDAQIVRFPSQEAGQKDLWVMFYFSAFNPTRQYNAYNTFAASYDLVHWTDWQGADLIVPSKTYDEKFAHKSYVVKWNGVVYHFYCAVDNADHRGIAVATSKFMGKSDIKFPQGDPAGGQRQKISLNSGWSIELTSVETPNAGYMETLNEQLRKNKYMMPMNLDDYFGARQMMHGNLHGEAVFRKKFNVNNIDPDKRYFLRFDGIGTYATIRLNGVDLGRHDVGRSKLTLDVNGVIRTDGENELEVVVSHPSGITDMPWVCGGCSTEWGFSEGSQPFGIYRPVTLEITDKVKVEPFGVQIWNNETMDTAYVRTEVKNYGQETVKCQLVTKLCDKNGGQVARQTEELTLAAGESRVISQKIKLTNPHLWSPEDPYIYKLNSMIKRDRKTVEYMETKCGFRVIKWPTNNPGSNQFMLNGKPYFINGVSEYEHILGASHAFSNEQIAARIKEAKLAGFNAFRDAHQPHNIKYRQLLEKEGMLWWPQFSAHIWYDTPEFRESFKRHLRQWVRERQNSPTIILWGLQNESTLPADFAKECADIIREMDPTCGSQRLVTTCNGGEGTDWNVVQNWSGTYGGDIDNYGNELSRSDQLLNGEYGAWRSIGNHTASGYSEEKFVDILERKIKMAESVKERVCGQFQWLLTSHDNPGRRQPDEGIRRADKIGPFNNKGLLTIWEQPTDGYYLYKEHYISSAEEPFVYRSKGGRVFTNCDSTTTGRPEPGLTTVTGYVDGKAAAEYSYVSDREAWQPDEEYLRGETGYEYLYRINCGGDTYTDAWGSEWMADGETFCHSWGDDFGMGHETGSQTADYTLPVSPLLMTSRYGRHRLKYTFPVPRGEYRIELYFTEPWYGAGTGAKGDYEDLRIFNIRVNKTTVIKDMDIWSQVHYGRPYKRVVNIKSNGSELVIDFPTVKASQAIIAAIAIARESKDGGVGSEPSTLEPQRLRTLTEGRWMALERDTISRMPDSLLPPRTVDALKVEGQQTIGQITWDFNVGVAKVYALRWKYYNPEGARQLHVKITDGNGVTYKDDDITFLQTQQKKSKRKMTSITTGGMINAGRYHVEVKGEGLETMVFDELTIE